MAFGWHTIMTGMGLIQATLLSTPLVEAGAGATWSRYLHVQPTTTRVSFNHCTRVGNKKALCIYDTKGFEAPPLGLEPRTL